MKQIGIVTNRDLNHRDCNKFETRDCYELLSVRMHFPFSIKEEEMTPMLSPMVLLYLRAGLNPYVNPKWASQELEGFFKNMSSFRR